MERQLKIIDLFSGAGGLTLGFEWLSKYSYKAVWANDFNIDATKTYNKNFGPKCIPGDIVDLLEDSSIEIPAADIIIGGPPCQGFSLLNKKRENDPRKKLWIPYMEVVRRSNAKMFIMENVPQLLGSLEHREILEHALLQGFNTWSGTLIAADYGVPQTRKRAFIVGIKEGDPDSYFPPLRTHYDPNKKPHQRGLFSGDYCKDALPWRTVRDVIGDLEKPFGTVIRDVLPPYDLHFGRSPTDKSLKRYMAIPEEGMNRFDLQRAAPEITPQCWINKKSGGTDLFGRLWWDRPSVTIRTEFFKPEKGRYLHPVQHRPITHREAARIQSFPDSFLFTGSKIEIARQIGNAVPPLLAKVVADTAYEMYMNSFEGKYDRYFYKTETTGTYVSNKKQEYEIGFHAISQC